MTTEELRDVSSVTVIVHGVGDPTWKTWSKALTEGFVASEIGYWSEPTTLTECPSLIWGKPGVEALLLHSARGLHLVVLQSWAKRLRAADVAKWFSIVLLSFGVLGSAASLFGDALNSFVEWLWRPWHWIFGILFIAAATGLIRIFTKAEDDFHPDYRYILLPSILAWGLPLFPEDFPEQ